jgi:glycerophosphoryl diester phosphodiesterase
VSHAFRVFAHRGDSAHAPENTLPAFDCAVALPAHGIETDVQVTSDGMPILFHDLSLKRTTGREANVADVSFGEIQTLDAGRWKGDAFAGTRIPTLDQALAKYLERIPFNIELKDTASAVPTVAALRKYEGSGSFERIVLTSFHQEWLVAAKRLDSRCRICPLLQPRDPLTVGEAVKLGYTAVSVHWPSVTRAFVDEAHAKGIAVISWGVKNLDAAKTIIDLGVDGCTYDDPGELLTYLKAQGLHHPQPPLLTRAYSR